MKINAGIPMFVLSCLLVFKENVKDPLVMPLQQASVEPLGLQHDERMAWEAAPAHSRPRKMGYHTSVHG
jgi:hypothetical protein